MLAVAVLDDLEIRHLLRDCGILRRRGGSRLELRGERRGMFDRTTDARQDIGILAVPTPNLECCRERVQPVDRLRAITGVDEQTVDVRRVERDWPTEEAE